MIHRKLKYPKEQSSPTKLSFPSNCFFPHRHWPGSKHCITNQSYSLLA